MGKWLIAADTKEYNHGEQFARDGYIDWTQNVNYKINDIVYIYAKNPIGKIIYKTCVEKESIYLDEDPDTRRARLRLIEEIDDDKLSFENLKLHGVTNNMRGPMRVTGELEEYIEKCFNNINKMWLVKAGPKGVLIDEFKKYNLISIGKCVGDVTNKNKNEIKMLCEKKYPNDSNAQIDDKVDLIYKFVNEIKVGDYILSYNKSKNEIYLGLCISNYYFADKINYSKTDECYRHYHDVEWSCTIKNNELSENAKTPLKIPQTVLEIKDERKKEFLDYTLKPFSSNEKRNKIYFGAPGTGKSHTLNIDKDNLLNCHKNNYERVTFHPDYSYANFVGTYKPVPIKDEKTNELKISYEYVPGPFMRVLINALKKPKQPFMLLIEEINRANAAAVFGDIFQLLDRDDKDYISKYPVYPSEDMKKYLVEELGEHFEEIKIPGNMFVWATMNSADQGVFPMDTAFKRRWDFKYFPINPEDNEMEKIEIDVDASWNLKDNKLNWNKLRQEINSVLSSYGINEDKLIGPYYAFHEYLEKGELSFDDFKDIFQNKILMYLYEDVARSKRPKLFEGVEGDITYSQIRNEFKSRGIKIFCETIRNKFIVDSNE